VGFLRIPYFRPTDAAGDEYAATAVTIIQEIDAQPTCGWVVDLRGNKGGNMWPMLAGVGPLLGDGEVGSFVNYTGIEQAWELRAGAALRGGEVVNSAPVYQLQQSQPPVAVLVDGSTASAGEAAMIAFIGRPNTRTFGEPTAGAATVPQFYELSDGAGLVLAAAWMADRTGATWDAEVPPDELVENFGPLNSQTAREDDEILQEALAWLSDEFGCN
jgi:C-terminal processing protease CtpA/Prc